MGRKKKLLTNDPVYDLFCDALAEGTSTPSEIQELLSIPRSTYYRWKLLFESTGGIATHIIKPKFVTRTMDDVILELPSIKKQSTSRNLPLKQTTKTIESTLVVTEPIPAPDIRGGISLRYMKSVIKKTIADQIAAGKVPSSKHLKILNNIETKEYARNEISSKTLTIVTKKEAINFE